MIPRECKRLAEVDFPIAVVSKHAAREKSIRHGHPSTLHLWWARRPLASCRAMLLALLLPNPCDEHCPADFKERAREILRPIPGRVGSTDLELREALLRFVGDFADWDHSASPTFLEAGRSLVKAAHPEERPLVVDPFAGGGSIPLEALRLDCDAFASDLNPVACLILKTMLEDVPRDGTGLADELRWVGADIKKGAERGLARLYPPDTDGARPIAYLWARTVRCEAPNCGGEIPLVRSFWLCSRAGRPRALRYRVARNGRTPPHLAFEVFTPKSELEVPHGTVTRARATCPCCGTTLAPDRVRWQLRAQQGGADVIFDEAGERAGGAIMLAVVTLRSNVAGREYRSATERDYAAVRDAVSALQALTSARNNERLIPDEAIDEWHHDVNRMPIYGMGQWGNIFTVRQRVLLAYLTTLIRDFPTSNSIQRLLALGLGRTCDQSSSLVRWLQTIEAIASSFGRQALPITWDFCESCPLGDASANFQAALEWIAKVIEVQGPAIPMAGQVIQLDAASTDLPSEAAGIWFTDPPYYDAIDYAHCSDFFFVWLKRAVGGDQLFHDKWDLSNPLTPKKQEIVVDSTTTKGHGIRTRAFYEAGMARAFKEGRRVTRDDGIGSVVFAHKTTEGWEALLSGMTKGGWVITGSWPIATERSVRLRSRESAALATSVHLVCRPRIEDKTGDWADVLRELPGRVTEWMARLEQEGVRGADLVFACIGPALEIFSRYSRVETAEGHEVPLAQYLEKVWEVVGRTALARVLGNAEAQASDGSAGALEEDARLTALFLWTHRSTGNGTEANGAEEAEEQPDEEDDEENGGSRKAAKGFTLIFDIVRRFAQPLGIHLPDWEERIIETKKGVVRLLPVSERARQLFGPAGVAGLADRIERMPAAAGQLELFPELHEAEEARPRGRRTRFAAAAAQSVVTQATTLDRVHTAMLLQGNGRANALRNLLSAEQQRGPDLFRLSQSLVPLYPEGHEERRLLEAMLLAAPR
jgi:putative DNA methylase